MKKLSATFVVPLSSPMIFRGPIESREYRCLIDNFEVVFSINADPGERSKSKHDRHWTYVCHRPRICVSHDESIVPKTRKAAPLEHSSYFEARLPEYRRVAMQALNNALAFFKYKLKQPIQGSFDEHDQGLQNPTWVDDNGVDVGHGSIVLVVPARHGLFGGLGCKHLTAKYDRALTRAMEKSLRVDLYEELLADAQAAAFQGNLRRSVLELAVACEVFVKQWFFAPGDRSGQVYEALENKRLIDVRVLDLLDVGGAAVFGKKFRDSHSGAYKDIDHLFRARNKVAHRGEAYFHDEAGKRQIVDLKMLTKWWTSIEKLVNWAR